MEFLLRLVQVHQTFRRPELEALAELHGLAVEFVDYSEHSPYCILRLPDEESARRLVSRSILAKSVYALWGSGPDYASLHASVAARTSSRWSSYGAGSFKFSVDTYRGARSAAEQRAIIQSFSYLGFPGRIQMKAPDDEFCVFEEYDPAVGDRPQRLFFGRLLGHGARDAVARYSLKRRRYISTTSMDSELALVMANIALAAPGKLFYDPFMGTGSLPIACSHYGAVTLGSDIDGRTIRGKGGVDVRTGYAQYGLRGRYLDGLISDLTHSPLRLASRGRRTPLLDGIVCDPPYGVREGLKVLGSKDGGGKEVVWLENGEAAHLREDHIPPKRPYGLEAILDDIMDFAAHTLVADGRLSLWMPTANDEDLELAVPLHAALAIVSICVQPFNKWSRRLLTYRRKRDEEEEEEEEAEEAAEEEEEEDEVDQQRVPPAVANPGAEDVAPPTNGSRADDLNHFRKRYFQGFAAAVVGGRG